MGVANRCVGARRGGVVLRQMLAILLAAVALGWIYNRTSPLGVRAPGPDRERPVWPAAGVERGSVSAPVRLPQPVSAPASNQSPEAASSVGTNPASPGTVAARPGLRWAEVKPLLESGRIVLVDARARTAFEAEHIPGAVSLPANAPPEEFVAFAMKYSQSTPIVVYCGGLDCDLSEQLAQKLRNDLGFVDVREMPGGIVEWRLAEAKTAAGPGR